MAGGAVAARLRDGRLHLQHGPIDLICWAEGEGLAAAYGRAVARFGGLLSSLVAELPRLRAPVRGETPPWFCDPVARRMAEAVWPHRAVFITPMAAVAGAVAEAVLAALTAGDDGIRRAYVNNGGDIALHLAPGERLRVGLVRSLVRAVPEGAAEVAHADPVRGVATSGWPGRSFSRGVADAVTVLAATAAGADAAATLIANAVDVDHPAVRRAPARAIDPDSDLGDLPVTVAVGTLPAQAVKVALDAGAAEAERLRRRGQIAAASLVVGDAVRMVGTPEAPGWRPIDGVICASP